jgi:hypothetical protein
MREDLQERRSGRLRRDAEGQPMAESGEAAS